MNKTLARVALALASCALLASITACSTAKSEYCTLLEKNTELLNSLSNPAKIDADAVTTLRSIEAVAPAKVKGDWKTFNDYMQAFVEQDTETLADTGSITKAGQNIDNSVTSECHLTLGN